MQVYVFKGLFRLLWCFVLCVVLTLASHCPVAFYHPPPPAHTHTHTHTLSGPYLQNIYGRIRVAYLYFFSFVCLFLLCWSSFCVLCVVSHFYHSSLMFTCMCLRVSHFYHSSLMFTCMCVRVSHFYHSSLMFTCMCVRVSHFYHSSLMFTCMCVRYHISTILHSCLHVCVLGYHILPFFTHVYMYVC